MTMRHEQRKHGTTTREINIRNRTQALVSVQDVLKRLYCLAESCDCPGTLGGIIDTGTDVN
jgi:hypothetical protein